MSILMLQLSCLLQPAGSSVFVGTNSLWRLTPIYCILDLTRMLYNIIALIIKFACPLPAACAIVYTRRHLSSKASQVESYAHPRAEGIICDMVAAQQTISQRRVLSIITVVVNISQFLKVATISGAKESIVLDQLLASIYFAYFVVQELVAGIVRFTVLDSEALHELDLDGMARFVGLNDKSSFRVMRDPLMFGVYLGLSVSLTLKDLYLHMGMIDLFADGLIFAAIRSLFSLCSDFSNMCLITFFLVVLWRIKHGWFQGYRERSRSLRQFQNWWFFMQGTMQIAVIVMYHVLVYDSRRTHRPDWTDWLG